MRSAALFILTILISGHFTTTAQAKNLKIRIKRGLANYASEDLIRVKSQSKKLSIFHLVHCYNIGVNSHNRAAHFVSCIKPRFSTGLSESRIQSMTYFLNFVEEMSDFKKCTKSAFLFDNDSKKMKCFKIKMKTGSIHTGHIHLDSHGRIKELRVL